MKIAQRTTIVARPRRLRSSPAIRALVRETQINRDGLVQPLFVVAGEDVVQPIGSMPGVSRYSVDTVVREWQTADPTTPVQPALHLIAVVAQGPGNLGTGTRWGFSGVQSGEAVNAVGTLGGGAAKGLDTIVAFYSKAL